MKVVLLLSGLVLALLVKDSMSQGTIATAIFTYGGVAGWVRFTAFPGGVTVVANLEGIAVDATWTIVELPVLTTLNPTMRASSDFVGDIYDPDNAAPGAGTCAPATPENCMVGDLTGRYGMIEAPLGTLIANDTTGQLMLTGRSSILGRSVVVVSGDKMVAATIRDKLEEVPEPEAVRIFTATFFFPVAGTIYFREVPGSIAGVQIYGKLYHTDSTTTTAMHNWHIHEIAPVEGYQAGLGCTETVGEHYDPFDMLNEDTADNYTTLCTPDTPVMCELGDLTGKFEPITVEGSPTPFSQSAFLFIDTNLTLTGPQNIIGRSVAIHEAGGGPDIIACAPIVMAEDLIASEYSATLIQFSQNSPYENTTVQISDNYPNPEPSVAIYEAVLMTNGLCPENDVVFNPFDVTATTPRGLTPDLFPLGDVPNKFNLPFFGPNTLELTELPVHGPNTLLARTIRIQETTGVRTCTTLIPAKNEDGGILLKATFKTGAVQGGVIMVQNNIGLTTFRGQTNVLVDLFLPDPEAASMGHGWVISEQSCEAIGTSEPTVFNPFGTVSGDCDKLNQLRCRQGDMTGKHGSLKLSGTVPSRPTYSFNDLNIFLADNYTVNGLSLVILGAGGSSNAIACATLNKRVMSDVTKNVVFSTPYSATFDRVKFVNKVVSVDPLLPMLPASNIIIFQEKLGETMADNVPCATLEMAIIAGSDEVANNYAGITQESICNRFGNDTCFKTLPNFDDLCAMAATTPNGGSAVSSFRSHGILLLGVVFSLLAWLAL